MCHAAGVDCAFGGKRRFERVIGILKGRIDERA